MLIKRESERWERCFFTALEIIAPRGPEVFTHSHVIEQAVKFADAIYAALWAEKALMRFSARAAPSRRGPSRS